MESLIKVNRERCTGCGLCIHACPLEVLEPGEKGPATELESCIGCGHCVAVCPTEALDHRQAPLGEQLPLGSAPALTAEQAAEFLRSRRSIRWYTDKPVPSDALAALLDIARHAPTGGNSQGVSWLALGNRETLRKITEAVVCYMETADSPPGATMARRIRNYRERGRDIVLLDAPCLVLALCDAESPLLDNAYLSILTAQLYAPALKLGTCWAGILEKAIRAGYPPLLELLAPPAGKMIAGAMMLGYPRYSYRRIPQRDPLLLEIRQ